ncbi:DUF4880 domain-containing protein [Hyphomicrobium sp. xq]|uniref:DUF4880 domain-containing protein n=1 Tax=Hyphomicrobium album TaxID=2665159 RepID=A0A6I3KFW9_9HYPH|nr:FecR domain-containing protein [Hyphomicrobium album]MTD92717.1 DUF4880 domain-containing protein [Hyphomicrobium album]
MTDPNHSSAEIEALKHEAQRWVLRLTSGEATEADAVALNRWRLTSVAHRQAFAEANLLWTKLQPATAISARDGPAATTSSSQDSGRHPAHLGRRAFLGGAIAAAAAYTVVRPPFELWPSLAELSADYRTGIGQQRQIPLTGDIWLKLNTRTSVSALSSRGGTVDAERIELISGELAAATNNLSAKPLVVVAGEGQTTATHARFNVRHDGGTVCVTCLDGELEIKHPHRSSALRSGQQVAYNTQSMGDAVNVDTDAVSAWERGLLVFRNDPLARVIEEVNRYRSGKIVLMNEALGRRPVLATFRIDRMDEVVPRLQAVFGVKIQTFPGGIVVVI